MRLYLISVRNLVVEVDASYIKGMLSNPDVQPNAAINRWIAAILLFDFKLTHVPADKHKGPDGLSRREPAPGEEEDDDPEDWVNHALSLGTWVVSWLNAFPTNTHHTDVLVLSLEANDDDDNDPAQNTRPRRDRRLPARYRNGDFVSSDTPRAPSRLRPSTTDNPSTTPPPQLDDHNNNNNNNFPHNNNNNNNSPLNNNNNNNSLLDTNNNSIDDDRNINNNNNNNSDIIDNLDAFDVSPIPNLDSNDHTTVKFSPSDKSDKADVEMDRIRQYLLSRRAPPNLSADALTRFISRANRFLIAEGRLWRRQHSGRHQLYARPAIRYALVRDAHDNLGHKGFYSTRRALLDRFWWPALETDVKWYIQTCHQCQIRQTIKVRIPPTVDTPAPLFRKAHIDTMYMPHAGGFRYIVQARCSLTAWPEWRALRTETGRTIGAFIFEEILCRWGAVEEIVTDNGTAYIAALDWLADKYGIQHIRISAYNSQANGIVERQHRTIRESIFKACDGDDSQWPTVAPFAFWADRATTRKSTGHSPFYMVHGVEPILPFDLVQATFLVPDLTQPLSTSELLAIRARQLQKRAADLATIHDRILASRHASIRQFEKQYANTIRDFDFTPGTLVLVRNSSLTMDKMKPRYLGPMIVLRRTRNGAYRLGELDGAVSRLRFAAFCLIPYHARSRAYIPVTHVVDGSEFASPDFDDTSERGAGDRNDESTREGRILKTPGGVSVGDRSALETSTKRYQLETERSLALDLCVLARSCPY
jgi:transposase InsO family protein